MNYLLSLQSDYNKENINRMKTVIMLFVTFFIILAVTIWRSPITFGAWNKQTVYVGMSDAWYGMSRDDEAHAMLIDDDSGEGVFTIKRICDEVGIQPVFAVIADKMSPEVAESLAIWQKQGAGIVLHGLRHERWKEWDKQQIREDIELSRKKLQKLGFDTTKLLKIIVPPHACNTKAIRTVIEEQKCQMVTGASLVNPDRQVFQLGRIDVTPQTNLDEMRRLLEKAYKRKAYVIFGTHSSMPGSFSAEKTQEVLSMAKEIGFCFDFLD